MKRLLLLALFLFVSLFHEHSARAQATNDSGISLVISGPTNIIKQGDMIPIQFILTNHRMSGVLQYEYTSGTYSGLLGYRLFVKTASGEEVSNPHNRHVGPGGGGDFSANAGGLQPGESLSKTMLLNSWASVKEAGQYEVVGASFNSSGQAYVVSLPISITVLPRTIREMDDYVRTLTNQVAARLTVLKGANRAPRVDPVLEELLMKLTFTCSPDIVPTMLRSFYEAGANTRSVVKEALILNAFPGFTH